MRSIYSVAFTFMLGVILSGVPAVVRADAAGEALLQKCIDAETQTRSLQADFSIQTNQGGRVLSTRGTLKLQKPNLALMTVSTGQEGGEILFASNGKKLFTYNRTDNEYRSESADAYGGNVGRKVGIEVTVFFYPDTLNQLKGQGTGVKITGNATIGGLVCKELKVIGGNPNNSVRIYIGPDNLLRGVSQSYGTEDTKASLESRLTNLKTATLPASTFAWTLPKGAKPFSERVANPSPSSGTSPEENSLLKTGTAAPDFQLSQTDGMKVSLLATAKSHKAILLNFWSSNVGSCIEELIELNKMLAELKDRGLEIITVNRGDDSKAIEKVWKEKNLNIRAAYNGEKTADKFHVQALPTNYVIGSDGRIIANFEGFDEDGIRKALAKAGVK